MFGPIELTRPHLPLPRLYILPLLYLLLHMAEADCSFASNGTPIRALLGLKNSGRCTEKSISATPLPSPAPLASSNSLGTASKSMKSGELVSLEDMCKCRKSKCLKLYCACFSSRRFCGDSCKCIECFNKPDTSLMKSIAEAAILERNPKAFESKIQITDNDLSTGQHRLGCRYQTNKILLLFIYKSLMYGSVDAGSRNA